MERERSCHVIENSAETSSGKSYGSYMSPSSVLAKSFASALGLDFQRLQFTPDLMPSDVVGTNVFQQESSAFHLSRGPIFTQILMADEINRTPPKTQAALLEAMQERQVTIDGERYPLGDVFFTIATQNRMARSGFSFRQASRRTSDCSIAL